MVVWAVGRRYRSISLVLGLSAGTGGSWYRRQAASGSATAATATAAAIAAATWPGLSCSQTARTSGTASSTGTAHALAAMVAWAAAPSGRVGGRETH